VYRTSAPCQPFFYLLFDRQSLGAVDPGDWYRFFGQAAATSFTLTGALEPVDQDHSLSPAVLQVDAIARQLLPDHATDDRRQRALVWINALQFWEWGMYSRSADATRRSAKLGLDAFRFGIRAAALDCAGAWRWHVPKPADLRDDGTGIDVAKARLEVEEPAAA
jgi:hypothetical protein